MKPRSRALFESGELQQRALRAREMLAHCTLCPRRCGVNRLDDERGFCRTGKRARVASYGPHFGEERPLVGRGGSGALFLASCNLHCCFCQNYSISRCPDDYPELEPEALAAIMLDLQTQGCHNINFVTPSHIVPQLLTALVTALERGLCIPLVYNCSGYDSADTLALLDGVIDIYLPDFKFWNSASARNYAGAADYPETARRALVLMHRQVGTLVVDDRGLAVGGLMVRHLLMPGGLDETGRILRFIASALSPATYVNIMDQYHPCAGADLPAELMRPVSPAEYRSALALARQAGLSRLEEFSLETVLRNLGIV